MNRRRALIRRAVGAEGGQSAGPRHTSATSRNAGTLADVKAAGGAMTNRLRVSSLISMNTVSPVNSGMFDTKIRDARVVRIHGVGGRA